MDKQHFLKRLGQWPKIAFSEVCLIPCAGNIQCELYVRDRSDPPCWLFIRRLNSSENPDSLQATYRQWLAEFHRQRHTFLLSAQPNMAFQAGLPVRIPDRLPAERQSAASLPLLIPER